jgi:DNA repair exonuclease SbcCD ATPase subunit
LVTHTEDYAEKIKQTEQTKEYLNSYRKLCKKLKSLDEQLRSIRETKESAKIQTISSMPKGNKQSDLSDYIVQLDGVYTKILTLRGECIKRRAEIESRIADMDDGIESMILHMRYIEFKPWEEICVEIGYEWAHTHRKHSEALRHF